MSKLCSVEVLLELYSPDVLCLSEHFLSQSKLDDLAIPGFCVKTGFCRSVKKCGGVCILVDCHLNCDVVDVTKFSREGICELAAIKVVTDLFPIIIVAIYRPPSIKTEDLSLFFELLQSCIESVVGRNCRVMIVGDFNIDMSFQNSPSSLLLAEFMLSFGMRPTIFSYTREFGGARSIIDNIFTDVPKNFSTSSVIVTGLSDHHAQICEVSLVESLCYKIPKTKLCRGFSGNNIRTFKKLLLWETWLDMYSASDIDGKFDSFLSTLDYYVNVVFPAAKVRVKSKKSLLKIPLDPELRQLRERMLTFYSLSKQFSSSHPIKQTFTNLKREFKARIHEKKSSVVLYHLENAANRQKALWSVVQELVPEKVCKPFQSLSVLDSSGVLVDNPKLVSEAFSSFFAEVGNKVGGTQRFSDLSCINSSSSLFLSPTNDEEVLQIIKALKSSKSAGIDFVSSNLLKDCATELVTPLVHLINSSFAEGKFPSSLKLALIKPIFKKKGSQNDCNSYRPISILSTFSKVLERVFLRRLDGFLSSYKILHENQFGFRPNTSTLNAVFCLVSEISRSLDLRDEVLALFLDLTKAFDMVNHQMLLHKLEKFGIRGIPLDWISSYLLERRQIVEIPFLDNGGCLRSQFSDEAVVRSGVPQGSVLGPVLFLLFINDLPCSVRESNLYLFADDTALVVSGPDHPSLEIKAFLAGCSALQWFNNNCLNLNADKTKLVEFCMRGSSSNPSNSLAFLLGEFEVNYSSNSSYLGIILDSKLNFSDHVNKVSSKLNSCIFLLRRLSCFGSSEILLTAYYGCFYPFLSYGVPIWGIENFKTKHIFSLQKKAIRIVFRLNRLQSCRSVFKANNLLTFPCIYILESVKFFKKNPNLFSFKHQSSSNYTLRNKHNIATTRCRTTFHQSQSHHSCIKLFNYLPKSLKLETETGKFVRDVRAFLIAKEYYSVQDFLNDGFN